MSTPQRIHLATLVAAGCAAALLTGCTQQDETVTGTETRTGTGTQTVTDTVTVTQDPQPDAPTDNCEDTDVDNPLTGNTPVPVRLAGSDVDDLYFHYSVSEDALDPCTPLSWVVLNGGNGTIENSNGTAGSSRQTVALFADGQLVTEPAPILARHIDSVERIDDSTVRVNYAFSGDAPAAADENLPGAATFHWDGNQIVVSDNTIPVELNEDAATLDLGIILEP